MFAISVDYTLGKVCAALGQERDDLEWPPHTARLGMAMRDAAASLARNGADENQLASALRRVEALGNPYIYAPEVAVQSCLLKFVPVCPPNIKDRNKFSGSDVFRRMPVFRDKMYEPTGITYKDTAAYFVWPDASLSQAEFDVVNRICNEMVYLGTSSSRIHARALTTIPVVPNYRPANDNDNDAFLIRPMFKGFFDFVDDCFRTESPVDVDQWARYVKNVVLPPKEEVAHTTFDPNFIVLKIDPPSFDLVLAHQLYKSVRGMLMKSFPYGGVPEIISGHTPKGDVSKSGHVSIFPMADVGHKHAKGKVHGVGIALLCKTSRENRETVQYAIDNWLADCGGRLRIGDRDVRVTRCSSTHLRSLDPRTWTRSSTKFASVTPVEFYAPWIKKRWRAESSVDFSAGNDRSVRMIVAMIKRAGLSDPTNVVFEGCNSAIVGAPTTSDVCRMYYSRKKGHKPSLAHVSFELVAPATGPVIIGSGCFRGFGLCLPL